jgi:hypothetical protein
VFLTHDRLPVTEPQVDTRASVQISDDAATHFNVPPSAVQGNVAQAYANRISTKTTDDEPLDASQPTLDGIVAATHVVDSTASVAPVAPVDQAAADRAVIADDHDDVIMEEPPGTSETPVRDLVRTEFAALSVPVPVSVAQADDAVVEVVIARSPSRSATAADMPMEVVQEEAEAAGVTEIQPASLEGMEALPAQIPAADTVATNGAEATAAAPAPPVTVEAAKTVVAGKRKKRSKGFRLTLQKHRGKKRARSGTDAAEATENPEDKEMAEPDPKRRTLSNTESLAKYEYRLQQLPAAVFACLDQKWLSVYDPSIRNTHLGANVFPIAWTRVLQRVASQHGVTILGLLPHYHRGAVPIFEVRPDIVEATCAAKYAGQVFPGRVHIPPAASGKICATDVFAYGPKDKRNDADWQAIVSARTNKPVPHTPVEQQQPQQGLVDAAPVAALG